MSAFVRRRHSALLPRIGEIFSAQHSGLSGGGGFGFHDPDDGDDPLGGADEIHGIQTEEGRDITTEGGVIIQAENQ